MEIRLAVLKSIHGENNITIYSVPFAVGRCRSANLIIADVNVSRNHCQIVIDNKLWMINDYSSSGTFINDVLIGKGKSKTLENGDIIRFGPAESNLSWTFFLNSTNGEQERESQVKNCLQEKIFNDLPCLNVKKIKEEWIEKQNPEENSKLHQEIQKKELKENNSAVERKIESEKIQELLKELEQVQNALSNLEEKNTALQVELAAGVSNKTESSGSNLIENLTELMESELQCTICSELFVTAVTLSCTHTFCKFCINQWKKKQKTCPICRKRISNETRSLVVDNYIDKMVANLSVELKARREAIIKERLDSEPVKKRRSHK